jgi:hypothetical protein
VATHSFPKWKPFAATSPLCAGWVRYFVYSNTDPPSPSPWILVVLVEKRTECGKFFRIRIQNERFSIEIFFSPVLCPAPLTLLPNTNTALIQLYSRCCLSAGRLAKDYTMQGWSGLQPFGVAKLTAATNIMISA